MGSLKILRSIQVSWDQKDSFIVTNILYLKLPVLCFRNSGIWGKKIFISMNLKNFLRIQKKKRNSEFSVRSIFTKKLNFSIEIVFIKGPELNNKRIKILWPFNQQKIQKDKNTDLKRKKPWSQPVFVFLIPLKELHRQEYFKFLWTLPSNSLTHEILSIPSL